MGPKLTAGRGTALSLHQWATVTQDIAWREAEWGLAGASCIVFAAQRALSLQVSKIISIVLKK